MIEAELPDGRILEFPDGTDGAIVQATVKRVLGVSNQPAPKPSKIGAEGLPDAIKEVSKDFSAPSKFAIGAAGAINDMAMRAKQLLGGNLTPEQVQGVKEYRALKDASPAAIAGDIGMNIAATAIPATAVQGGLTSLAARAVPAFAAPAVGAAATGAGVAATTEAVLPGESTAEKAALGALGGAAGDVAARGLSRVVQPIRQSGAVQKLLSEGVTPTPGQAAGAKSFVGRFEQRLESLPDDQLVNEVRRLGAGS